MASPGRAGPSTPRQDLGDDVAAPTSESLVHAPLIDPWIRKVVFLGTGTSGQIPAAPCVLPKAQGRKRCEACADAIRPGSKNRRGCCSAMVIGAGLDGVEHVILIDCGPTFYESALNAFRQHKQRRITALLLTHAHADAMLGLDSLRAWTMRGAIQQQIDVYCTQEAFEGVQNTFPYLVDESKATGSGSVGALKFHLIDPARPFEIDAGKGPIQDVSGKALLIEPLLVEHGLTSEGASFPCLGFRIGSLAYISDVSSIPPSTRSKLKGARVLVIDSLSPRRHISHYSLAQAVEESLRVAALNAEGEQDGPRLELALLTDLAHGLEHHSTDQALLSFVAGLREHRSRLPLHQQSEKKHDPHLSDAMVQEPTLAGAKQAAEQAEVEVEEQRWWLQHWDSLTADDSVLNPDGLPRLRSDLPAWPQLHKTRPVSTLLPAVGWMVQTCSSSTQTSLTSRSAAKYHVPDMRVSFDGLCIPFGPDLGASSCRTLVSPMLGLSTGLTQGLANFLRPDGKLETLEPTRAEAGARVLLPKREGAPALYGEQQPAQIPQRGASLSDLTTHQHDREDPEVPAAPSAQVGGLATARARDLEEDNTDHLEPCRVHFDHKLSNGQAHGPGCSQASGPSLRSFRESTQLDEDRHARDHLPEQHSGPDLCIDQPNGHLDPAQGALPVQQTLVESLGIEKSTANTLDLPSARQNAEAAEKSFIHADQMAHTTSSADSNRQSEKPLTQIAHPSLHELARAAGDHSGLENKTRGNEAGDGGNRHAATATASESADGDAKGGHATEIDAHQELAQVSSSSQDKLQAAQQMEDQQDSISGIVVPTNAAHEIFDGQAPARAESILAHHGSTQPLEPSAYARSELSSSDSQTRSITSSDAVQMRGSASTLATSAGDLDDSSPKDWHGASTGSADQGEHLGSDLSAAYSLGADELSESGSARKESLLSALAMDAEGNGEALTSPEPIGHASRSGMAAQDDNLPLAARPPLETRDTLRPPTAQESVQTPTADTSKEFLSENPTAEQSGLAPPLSLAESERTPVAEVPHVPFPTSTLHAQQHAEDRSLQQSAVGPITSGEKHTRRKKKHRRSKGPRRPAELGEGAIPARGASLSADSSPSHSRSGSEAGSSRTTSDASYTGSEFSVRLGVGEQSVDSVKSASTSANSSPKIKGFADRIRSRVSSLASVRSRKQSSKSTSEHDDRRLSEHKRTESFSK